MLRPVKGPELGQISHILISVGVRWMAHGLPGFLVLQPIVWSLHISKELLLCWFGLQQVAAICLLLGVEGNTQTREKLSGWR